MKVFEITQLSVTENFKVVPSTFGLKKGWKVVNTATGAEEGTYRIRSQADRVAKQANVKLGPSNLDNDKKGQTGSDDDDDDTDRKKKGGIVDKAKNLGSQIAKFAAQTVVGKIFFTIFSVGDLIDALDRYGDAYEASGCNPNNRYVIAAQVNLVDEISGLLVGFLSTAATTAASIALFSRLLGTIPGLGWLVAILGTASGGYLAYLLGKLSQDTGFVKGLSNALMNTMFGPTVLKKLSLANCNIGEAQDTLPKKLPVNKYIKQTKKSILKDPKLKKVIAKAKAKAS